MTIAFKNSFFAQVYTVRNSYNAHMYIHRKVKDNFKCFLCGKVREMISGSLEDIAHTFMFIQVLLSKTSLSQHWDREHYRKTTDNKTLSTVPLEQMDDNRVCPTCKKVNFYFKLKEYWDLKPFIIVRLKVARVQWRITCRQAALRLAQAKEPTEN